MLTTGKAMGAGGAGGAAQTISFVASSQSASTTLTLPQAPLANDIIVVSVHDYGLSPTSASTSLPSGFTAITTAKVVWNASYAGVVTIGYKKATGSEGTSLAGFSTGAVGDIVACGAIYRPSFSASTVAVADIETLTNSGTMTINSGSSSNSVIAIIGFTSVIPSSVPTPTPATDFSQQTASGNTGPYFSCKKFDKGSAANISVSVPSGGLGTCYAHAYLSLS